jgi:hypothetical protein
MTGITRRIVRETSAATYSKGRLRPIIIELDPRMPSVIGLRLKKTKTPYYIDAAVAWRTAVRMAVEQQKAERAAARKAKRKAG